MKKSKDGGVARRDILKLTAGAMLVPALPQAPARLLRFFTPEEFAMVDELAELIIPADDHSPGARAAEVAAFLDQHLSEAEAEERGKWRENLRLLNQLSADMHGAAFAQATPAQRLALLTRIAKMEAAPQKPEEKFFVELKAAVAHAYYTSKIGLHDELGYLGNTYLREFVGEDVSRKG